MRKPGGYLTIVDPEKPTLERDTFTCAHCNSIVIVKPKQDPSEMGGFCLVCMANICKGKECNNGCTPFLKKIEKMEKRAEFRRKVFG